MKNQEPLGPPIFVIGNPRSGTTLLRLMLTSHSHIVVPPECGFSVWLLPKYTQWRPDPYDAVDELLGDIVQCRKFETWGVSYKQLAQFFASRLPQSYPDAVSAVYECYGRIHGFSFRRWGDKNNFYLGHISELNAMFPEAMFIHIVRDGRDVACAYRRVMSRDITSNYAPHLPVDIYRIAEQWHRNITQINRSFDVIGRNRVVELRLEDLKKSPEFTLQQLCDRISEPYDPLMLEYHIANKKNALEPIEFLKWKEDTVKPLNRSADGRYRHEMTRREIAVFNSIAYASLRRYDYL